MVAPPSLNNPRRIPAAGDVPSQVVRCITSKELFAGAHAIAIDHDGRIYQLRVTQNGKLILTA